MFVAWGLVLLLSWLTGCSGGLSRQKPSSNLLTADGRFPGPTDPNYQKTYQRLEKQQASQNVVSPALGYNDAGATGQAQPAATAKTGPIHSFTSGIQSGFSKVSSALTPAVPAAAGGSSPDPTALASKSKPSADLHVATARLKEQGGKPREAEQGYERALKVAPKHLGALMGLARLKDREGQFVEATALYQRAAKAHPEAPAVFNDLGLCFARRKMYPESVASLERAVQLDPKSALVRQNLATVLVETSQVAAAFDHLRAVQPEAVAYYNLGYLLQKKGQTSEAAHCFAMALEKDPSMQPAAQWLAALGGPPQAAPAMARRPAPPAEPSGTVWVDDQGRPASPTGGFRQLPPVAAPPSAAMPTAPMPEDYGPGGAQSVYPLPPVRQ
jgi:tetratricopeptide (TPR) repeat protein